MSLRPFGSFGGRSVEIASIAAGRIRAEVASFGAIVQDLVLDDGGPADGSVVLGFDAIEGYLAADAYIGAVAGRYANRIAGGRFSLDGAEHRLSLNENGRTHLHGGGAGAFSRRLWRFAGIDDASVRLELVSEHGEEGYPGTLRVACTYTALPPATLRIDFEATTDRPTIVNLAQHAYFNLDGGRTISDHRLEIPASRYTPVDENLIPTGELAEVAGTPFDFRGLRPIHDGTGATYDVNFALDREGVGLFHAATLEGPVSGGRRLDIWTTEPGLQFYDGSVLREGIACTHGRRLGRFAGLCLEPQKFPNSPNVPGFPSAVLRPGEVYRQTTELRFSTSPA